MSTTATPASNPGAAPVHGPLGLRKAASQAGTDLFASLLALVGDTRQGGALAADPAASESLLSDPLSTDSTLPEPLLGDEASNPLSGLLNWTYPSGLGELSVRAEAAGQIRSEPLSTGARFQTPTPAQAAGSTSDARPTPGIDLGDLGLAAVSPQDSTDNPAPAWLAKGLAAVPATPLAIGNPAPAPVAQAVSLAQAVPRMPAPVGPTASETPGAASADRIRKSGPSLTATLQARDAIGSETARFQPHAPSAGGRSTVTLDSRMVTTGWRSTEADTPTLATAAAAVSELRRAPGERSAPRDQLAPLAAEPGALAGRPADATIPSKGEALTELLQGSPEAEGETPGHLGTHQLRHASLRVGEGSAEAIDVQLKISGQEVRVDFRTDNAETRQGLQQSASPALGDLLERSGMQLGSVSVGGQSLTSGGGQSSGSGGDAERRHTAQASRTGGTTGAAPAAPTRPRTDGSRPLDVFA